MVESQLSFEFNVQHLELLDSLVALLDRFFMICLLTVEGPLPVLKRSLKLLHDVFELCNYTQQVNWASK